MKLIFVLMTLTSSRLISIKGTKSSPNAQAAKTSKMNERIKKLQGKKIAPRLESFRSRTIQLTNCFYDQYEVLCIGKQTTNEGLYTSFIDNQRKRRQVQSN